jgi:RNA polymerase-binding transcription factor DksA
MAKKNWTDKDYLYFHDLILKKRTALHLEISKAKGKADEILKSSSTNALYSSHMADASSDHVELEKSYYMIARNKKFSTYLDKALVMIEDKSFGICQTCEELIQKERLEEVPHTTKCFACKSNR